MTKRRYLPTSEWSVSSSLVTLATTLVASSLSPTSFSNAESAPFCGYNTARNSVSVILTCDNGVINNVTTAFYGTPTVLPGDCQYARNTSCDSPNFLALAQQTCVGKSICTVTGDSSIPDPCPEVVKSVAVVAQCDIGPGRSIFTVPSCALTSGSPPCPLPTWAPNFRLNKATICQPGNTDSYLNATEAARWGIVSLDWSIANQVWNPPGTPANETTGAATLVEQARQIKAVDPSTKVFVYRNTELALEWLEPQRAAMYNASMANYFLQYQPNNPSGTPAGTIYNEDAGAPAGGLKQYFWNYSVPEVWDYVSSVSEMGPYGTASPYVDGTFYDDSQAIPQEHNNAPANLGLSELQLLELQNSTYRYFDFSIQTLAAAGKYAWQGFNNYPGGDPDAVSPGPNQGSCLGYMQMVCDPAWRLVPNTLQWGNSDKEQTIAALLLQQNGYCYMGYGWNGGPLPDWDPIWDAYDVGTPTSWCAEVSPGVFSRNWTNGNVSLDCNTWTATLNF